MYNIDNTRIYATGMSNGGFMSFLLACQLSDRIAAIASVTGSMTPETFNNSNPQHPTPVIQMHSPSDPVVPYNGSSWTKSVDEVLQYWVGHNNCNTTPDITILPDLDPNDGSTVEHIVYEGGDNGVNVEHYKIIGGGHTWPGSAYAFPGTNYDIHASTEIWNFFSKYDISGLINLTDIIQPNNSKIYLNIYPNPSTSSFTIESAFSEGLEYELISSIGNLLMQGMITSHKHQINVSHLPASIYLLKIGNEIFKIYKTK
jgi:polyhydroxybutyrate depolymerase